MIFLKKNFFFLNSTHSNAEVLNVFGLGELDALGEGLEGAVGCIVLDEEPVDVLAQRPHHQAHHHALEDGVEVEEFVRLQLQPLLLHLLLEFSLSMFNLRIVANN